jgi:hypothetical protein
VTVRLPFRLIVLAGLALAPFPFTSARAAEAGLSAAEAVNRYAPVVYLHSEDEYRPMTAATFVRGSKLRWHHDDGCGDDDVDWYPDAARLATGGYRHQGKSERNFFGGCDHSGEMYLSNEDVRPRDGDNKAGGEGMYLDLSDSLRGGEGTKAPVYYDVHGNEGSRAINYWFLYGNSRPNIRRSPDFSHEGDWEHITVLLGPGNRARQVYYAQHHGGCVVKLDPRDRPTVFSAKGGHASYPKRGEYDVSGWGPWDINDQAKGGTLWETRGLLRPLSGEAWYGKKPGEGFGGGWGQVGPNKELTGPQGPHRTHKTGLPAPDAGPCKDPDRTYPAE